MLHILIDGYNLIAKMGGMGRSLEDVRKRLISLLRDYRYRKHHEITVVFDGEKGGFPEEGHEQMGGITIIFSRLGEKADDVIKRMTRSHRVEYTVITSDKEIASFAESMGHIAIPSESFIPKLMDMQYGDDLPEEDDPFFRLHTKKRGNPRRLSRTERKRRSRLSKL